MARSFRPFLRLVRPRNTKKRLTKARRGGGGGLLARTRLWVNKDDLTMANTQISFTVYPATRMNPDTISQLDPFLPFLNARNQSINSCIIPFTYKVQIPHPEPYPCQTEIEILRVHSWPPTFPSPPHHAPSLLTSTPATSPNLQFLHRPLPSIH